jgi:hypothetical protein
MLFTKGRRVAIHGNSIFEFMGYSTVTGTVFVPRTGGFSFRCDQTGAIETVNFGDGVIEVLND